MEFLVTLWLPILVSAVAVFLVSSIIHMALPIHKGDCKALPNEAKILESMRASGVAPGSYMFPCPSSMKEMCSPEMMGKYKLGPVGHLTVMPSAAPAMGKCLTQWFIFSILISVFAAYLGTHGLGASPSFAAVMRVTGTAALLGYAVSHVQDSIWKGMSWSITLKFCFDGLLYSLATGAIFAWLWPR